MKLLSPLCQAPVDKIMKPAGCLVIHSFDPIRQFYGGSTRFHVGIRRGNLRFQPSRNNRKNPPESSRGSGYKYRRHIPMSTLRCFNGDTNEKFSRPYDTAMKSPYKAVTYWFRGFSIFPSQNLL